MEQSSCYFLDMRNSTTIVRAISLHDKSKSEKATNRLITHAEFMLSIHELLNAKLAGFDKQKYYFDDTGDGHFCLIWTKTHAWDLMDMACTIARFLTDQLKSYNENELKSWSAEWKEPLKLNFGIGLHTGGSIVYEDEVTQKLYAFGVVLNTASRMESYTKSYKSLSILISGNFKKFLRDQQFYLKKGDPRADASIFKKIKRVSSFKIDIKDSKEDGHVLYTILEEDFTNFITG